MADNGTVSAKVDYERHCFVARDGTELTLQPISKMILERLYSDQHGRPKPPIVEVMIGGQFTRKEANPDDPDYQKSLSTWEAERSARILKYGLVHGVVENPPLSFVQEYAEYFPDQTEADMKYLWIVSLLGTDGQDVPMISEAIIGQTAPTEGGMKEAEDSFQSDDGRDTGDTVSPIETAD